MDKETVRKVRRAIVRPAVATLAIGGASLLGGLVDFQVNSYNVPNDAKRAFPSIASSEEIRQSKKQILVFDRRAHDLVLNLAKSGTTIVDISTIPDYPKFQQAIELLKEQEEIAQKRVTFENRLTAKRVRTRTLPAIAGGGVLSTIALVMILNKRGRKQSLAIKIENN